MRHLALVRADTPAPAAAGQAKACQAIFTAFFAFYAPTCAPPGRRHARRRRAGGPRQLQIPPIQRLFAALVAFYAPTPVAARGEKIKVKRRHRRRRAHQTQMRLPLRKNRRRTKPFCLGTGKLTAKERQEAARRAQREAARRRRHLPVLQRPQVRGDCQGQPRPCPWVGCRHHLYLDVNPENGSIKLNFPGVPLEKMTETCSLDVADRGGETLDVVGDLLNITMERVRQIEVDGLPKLRDGLSWQDGDLYQ